MQPVRLRCSVRGSELRYSALRALRVFLGTQPRAHIPEPSGSSTHPVKRQTPETSSHHSVRPISGAYHQLLGFFILRAWS